MTDIFISYSRDDRDTAHALADALEAKGHDVWWDRELTGGGDFAAEIERHLAAARLVIVLWSKTSVQSDFVRDESSRARDQRKLLPVRIEDVALPLGFGTLHTLDLIEWDGDPDNESLVDLFSQVRERLEEAARRAGGRGALPFTGVRRSTNVVDPLTRRRTLRRWLIGLGATGLAAAGGGVGWYIVADSRRERARTALAHLEKAIGHHFEVDPPELKKAELEYRLATDNDPTLAEAFYYWGHLTIALMERKQPKPSPAELAGLREDALERFRRSLQLAVLGQGQRAVAEEQITWLAASEPAPLERSTNSTLLAQKSRPDASVGIAPDPSTPGAAQPVPPPTARPVLAPSPAGGTAATGAPSGAAAGSGANAPPPLVSPRPTELLERPAQPPPGQAVPNPRRPPDQELARRAEAEVSALFAADRDSRLGARSLLAGDPQLAAEALPAALATAQASLGSSPPDASRQAGLAATVQLVENATPSVVQANRSAIETLQRSLVGLGERAPAGAAATLATALQRSRSARPVVFLQITNERQAPLARQLLQRFEAAGYASAEIERVDDQRAPARPEVRSHGGSDPAMARWCQQKLGELVGTPAVLRNLRGIRPDNDVFEIWFDATLCAPGGRQVDGCASS